MSAIRSVNLSLPRDGRCCRYADSLIVGMYMWSVIHDRPRSWAADRNNYYGPFRPRCIPSLSQFMRRIGSLRCRQLIARVHQKLNRGTRDEMAFVDGHALAIRRHSRDPDARSGRGVGGMQKGYKLHAYVTKSGFFSGFEVTPMNVCEKNVAYELLRAQQPRGIVMGDAYFDDAKLHDATTRSGGRFIAPPRKNAGKGHCRQSSARLEAIARWPQDQKVYHLRRHVERLFGQLVSFGAGLKGLPSWVRRWHRVHLWVTAKIIIYHARIIARNSQS